MRANPNCMKFKLSPFLVLFLSLNSILIFCASRKADSEKKPSTGLTHTSEESQLSSDDNFDAAINDSSIRKIKLPASEVSYHISSIISEKEQRELNPILENSVEDSFTKDSDEQKSENL